VEIFFKMLKQNLRIKSFGGTSANSVWTQIWTALIAMLIIKYLQFKARYQWSFSNLIYFLRMNFFVYRDLWEWLDHSFADPPPFNGVSAVGACMGLTCLENARSLSSTFHAGLYPNSVNRFR